MLFKNRNWLKVLIPQIVMVVLTLAVFFGCWWMGVRDKATLVIIFFSVFVVSIATTFATAAIVLVALFVVATTSAVASLFALAAVFASTNSPTVAVAATIFAAVITVLGFFTAIVVTVVAEEYNLPWGRVIASYLAEATLVSIPIYCVLMFAN